MSPLKRGERVAAAGFLAPVMLFYAAFILIPIVATVVFCFVTIDRFTMGMTFAGLEKFEWVYTDWRFWRTFLNTFYFIALAVTGNVGLGLLLAVLLDRALPRSVLYLFRLAYFFPVLVSVAFVSYIWRFLYGDDLGVINYYLRSAGLPGVPWLSSTMLAMISIVIMDVWKHVGFFMIILLAALQGVPKELVEAATLDGASRRGVFRHVTLPCIAPVILFCVTYATIGGLQVFDSIRILTEGGPGDATRSVVMYMIGEAFSAGDLSAGSVAALTLLIVVSMVVALQARLARRWVST
ncbi:MAG: carbohydrate ABC transporter permease [Lautropia sp.]